jgi:hypothetical protein
MQQVCTNKDFFVVQSRVIQKSIEEDKWYLSEQQGKDVGWEMAKEHFINTYFAGFAAGFRASYCTLTCPLRHDCAFAKKFIND